MRRLLKTDECNFSVHVTYVCACQTLSGYFRILCYYLRNPHIMDKAACLRVRLISITTRTMTPTGTPPTIHDLAPELIYQIMENFKPEGPIIYQKRVTHGSSVDHDLPAIQTIGAFRLTCSHLNAVTRPLLFHSVGFGNFQHERIRQFRELIDEDPTIAPAVRIFWLYGKRVGQGNQNLYQPTNMRKFWNSHDLPKILDRLICVESFGFVIPSIYSVDPAFSWDTLSEEMKLGISNLLSRPSITSLTFRCLTALPVALFTTSPSLRHLNVGLIDKVKSHVASSHMPLTTNVAPRAHRKVGWTIQSLNAEQGSQSLLSLHPTIEGCMSWNQCPPDCFSAITLRSKRFLKDLTIQLYYGELPLIWICRPLSHPFSFSPCYFKSWQLRNLLRRESHNGCIRRDPKPAPLRLRLPHSTSSAYKPIHKSIIGRSNRFIHQHTISTSFSTHSLLRNIIRRRASGLCNEQILPTSRPMGRPRKCASICISTSTRTHHRIIIGESATRDEIVSSICIVDFPYYYAIGIS